MAMHYISNTVVEDLAIKFKSWKCSEQLKVRLLFLQYLPQIQSNATRVMLVLSILFSKGFLVLPQERILPESISPRRRKYRVWPENMRKTTVWFKINHIQISLFLRKSTKSIIKKKGWHRCFEILSHALANSYVFVFNWSFKSKQKQKRRIHKHQVP